MTAGSASMCCRDAGARSSAAAASTAAVLPLADINKCSCATRMHHQSFGSQIEQQAGQLQSHRLLTLNCIKCRVRSQMQY